MLNIPESDEKQVGPTKFFAPITLFAPTETRFHEHAVEQRRHGFVQRHVVRGREDVPEDQNRGQHRRRERGASGCDKKDLEEDQS